MTKGIITFYINRPVFKDSDEHVHAVEMQKKINKDLIAKLEEMGYMIMYMTTTGESSRIEKVDF